MVREISDRTIFFFGKSVLTSIFVKIGSLNVPSSYRSMKLCGTLWLHSHRKKFSSSKNSLATAGRICSHFTRCASPQCLKCSKWAHFAWNFCPGMVRTDNRFDTIFLLAAFIRIMDPVISIIDPTILLYFNRQISLQERRGKKWWIRILFKN